MTNALVKLFRLRDIEGLTWREIAKIQPFCGIPIGTLHKIYQGEKIPRKWLGRFGIFEDVQVVAVEGRIEAGAMVPSSQDCEGCGRPFVSNHPRRRKCYLCSPIRRRV